MRDVILTHLSGADSRLMTLVEGPDAASIQAAIDTRFQLGGGLVLLAPRAYTVESPIIVRSNIQLCGSGRSSVLVGETTPTTLDGVLDIQGDDVLLTNFAIEGQRDSGAPNHRAIVVRNAARLKIRGLWVVPRSAGLGFHKAVVSDSTVTHDNIEITDCFIDGCWQEAIHLQGVASGVRIERNSLTTLSQDGIKLAGTQKNGWVRDNYVEPGAGFGVTVGVESQASPHPTQRWNVSGNVVIDGGGTTEAAVFSTGQAMVMSSNIVDGYDGDGVYFKALQGVMISNVVSNVTPEEGALKSKGAERNQPGANSFGYGPVIVGNTVFNSGTWRGLHCTSSEATVVGNRFDTVGLSGIEFQESTGENLAVGNSIRGVTGNVGGIRQHGAGRGLQVGNMILNLDNDAPGGINWRNATAGTFDYMVAEENLMNSTIVLFGLWANFINVDNIFNVPDV